MKVTKIYGRNRRDCLIDLECENCGNIVIGTSAYDDYNFWENVIPNRKCKKCGETTKTIGITPVKIEPRYSEGMVV